tara:strand:+ start:13444 stop:13767 length:324 start_codon:yes stop_codon:yes gene_type:complete
MENKKIKICPCCNGKGFVSSNKVFKKMRMTKKRKQSKKRKTRNEKLPSKTMKRGLSPLENSNYYNSMPDNRRSKYNKFSNNGSNPPRIQFSLPPTNTSFSLPDSIYN